MATLEDYFAAQQKEKQASAALHAIANKLAALEKKLRAPLGVRLNKVTAYVRAAPNHLIVDRDDLVTWERLEEAVNAYVEAGNWARRVEGELTPEQRRMLQSR